MNLVTSNGGFSLLNSFFISIGTSKSRHSQFVTHTLVRAIACSTHFGDHHLEVISTNYKFVLAPYNSVIIIIWGSFCENVVSFIMYKSYKNASHLKSYNWNQKTVYKEKDNWSAFLLMEPKRLYRSSGTSQGQAANRFRRILCWYHISLNSLSCCFNNGPKTYLAAWLYNAWWRIEYTKCW